MSIQSEIERIQLSKNNIKEKIESYGVDINDIPFQQYDTKIGEIIPIRLKGLISGTVSFELEEQDFLKSEKPSENVVIKYAFYRRYTLTKAIIPDFIVTIGQYAFSNISSLTEVVLKGNTQIEISAFSNCTKLEKFYLPDVTSANEIPKLQDVNAFSSTPCYFIVSDRASQALYQNATNWSAFSNRIGLEEDFFND